MDEPSPQTAVMLTLLQRFRQGDLACRDELLLLFGNRFELLAAKMLRRYPQLKIWLETGDIVQNTLIRLLRTLQTVEPATVVDFFGLASLEMRRELLDLHRHFYGPHGMGANHAHHSIESNTVFTQLAQPDSDDLERWQDLHEGVEKLPSEEREVFSLIFYQGLTHQRAGEVLQVTERTIRRRWKSALAHLNRHVAGSQLGSHL